MLRTALNTLVSVQYVKCILYFLRRASQHEGFLHYVKSTRYLLRYINCPFFFLHAANNTLYLVLYAIGAMCFGQPLVRSFVSLTWRTAYYIRERSRTVHFVRCALRAQYPSVLRGCGAVVCTPCCVRAAPRLTAQAPCCSLRVPHPGARAPHAAPLPCMEPNG